MRDFFSLDGAFNKYGGILADTIILSLLWFFFSLPIITIGASTSAVFYVSTRRIADREGYITSDFWFAFKANFKRGTALWVMVALVMVLIYVNILNIGVVGRMSMVILPAQIIIAVQIMLMCVYLFPLTARFDMGLKQTIKSAFFMANRHLLTSLTCVGLFVILIAGVWVFQPLLIAIPGIYAMIASYLIMRIFKRYRPEMDKDPILEIQEIEAQKAEERRIRGISTMDVTEAETVNEADVGDN